MKRFSTIIFAVAALTMAFSCATDATEDLGVTIGDRTVLTISLDDTSRVALGEKSGEEYAAVWSAGDKISVNGITSSEAVINPSNPASASFSFDATLTTPYNVVYPAAEAGKVLFAEEQSFANGTFSAGATPLYGYSEGGNITLQHLAGVLKIGVTGAATLTKAQISNVGAPIAGLFSLDCATGKVEASTEAVEIIHYSFGEGLALTDEVQYIHIAVPAGIYNELYVTLYDNVGGVMNATVKAPEAKPLEAGAVREFTNTIPYVANSTDYIISDYASLCGYAEVAAEKGALVVENITIPADAVWTPIAKICHSFNGNGYEISGLTAPLCDTISAAAVKNLKLTNVNITETLRGRVGALARTAVDASVQNCTTKGTLLMNNTTYAEALLESLNKYDLNIGGLVGCSAGTSYKDCTNGIALTLTSASSSESGNAYIITVGGISGLALLGTTTGCSFEDCTNDAKILYNGTYTTGTLLLSGLVGSATKNSDVAVYKNLTNTANGVIEVAEDATAKAPVFVQGCVGNIYNGATTIEKLTNYADLKFLGAANGSTRVAGVCSYLVAQSCVAKGLVNYGDITLHGACGISAGYAPYISGIVSDITTNNVHTLQDCHNYGDLDINQKIYAGQSFRIGGISAYVAAGTLNMTNCSNEGNITVAPVYSQRVYFGGLIGDLRAHFTYTSCVNKGNLVCHSSNSSTSKNTYHIGGLNGYINLKSAVCKFDGCTNDGDILYDGTSYEKIVYIGGTMGSNENIATITWIDTTNNGDIVVGGTATSGVRVGGFLGDAHTSVTILNLSNCVNNGDVSVSTTTKSIVAIAGFFGVAQYTEDTFTNCANNGAVAFIGTAQSGNLFIGGYIGYKAAAASGGTAWSKFTGSSNSGAISNTGTCNDSARTAGFVGGTYAALTFTSCQNSGPITVNLAEGSSTSATDPAVGGFVGDVVNANGDITFTAPNASSNITACKNTGTLTLMGVNGQYAHVGGIVGAPKNSGGYLTADGVINEGDIVVKNVTGKHIRMGGIAGTHISGSDILNSVNKGKITVENLDITHAHIGGIVGHAFAGGKFSQKNVNLGDITVRNCTFSDVGTGEDDDRTEVGGIVGYSETSIAKAECYCNLVAVDQPYAGMIMGSHRTTDMVASNCKVGGTIALTGEMYEDADTGIQTIKPTVVPIDATNYFNYIYGGTTEWSGTSYDNCTLLTSAPVVE